jgi:multiple sugar transport system substrate-binding protein
MRVASDIKLNGVTWNHTRGFVPKVATGQRFHELRPNVEIAWRKRSLQDFADYSIERLAQDFDLLVIDHPSIGEAAAHGLFLPLDELLPADFFADQAANSVGASHASYIYDGHQWALAIDAATPVASWRPDLLARHKVAVPQTWDELMELARHGLVGLPAIAVDSLMNLYMLWLDEGEEPFLPDGSVASRERGEAAFAALAALVEACPEANLQRNPIQTYEAMTTTDDIAYCPFAYGYSNYARSGYARATLAFGGLVTRNKRLRSTLGGAGLAISASCRNPQIAAEYAMMMASPGWQRGIYVASGGQPGHRTAWTDPAVNQMTGNFFRDTLSTLDEAYLRPRYDRYIAFQTRASEIVYEALAAKGSGRDAIAAVAALPR